MVPFLEPMAKKAALSNRIFVASIHPDLPEEDVRAVFEAFGAIKRVVLAPGALVGWRCTNSKGRPSDYSFSRQP
jgi:hypothetical protein